MATKPKSSTPYRHKTKGVYPSVTDWFGIVPDEVARSQAAWERDRLLYKMHEAGMTYVEIAERCGIHPSTASLKSMRYGIRYERRKHWNVPPSPIEQYFAGTYTKPIKPVRFEITVRTGEKHDCTQNDQDRRDDRGSRDALDLSSFYFGDA